MTEFELLEVHNNVTEQAFAAAGLYFTLVSAFLIMSYLAARRLTSEQIFIVSFFYTLWVSSLIHGIYRMTIQYQIVERKLLEIGSELLAENVLLFERVSGYGFTIIQLLGLAASLYFMWSVRHPKTE